MWIEWAGGASGLQGTSQPPLLPADADALVVDGSWQRTVSPAGVYSLQAVWGYAGGCVLTVPQVTTPTPPVCCTPPTLPASAELGLP